MVGPRVVTVAFIAVAALALAVVAVSSATAASRAVQREWTAPAGAAVQQQQDSRSGVVTSAEWPGTNNVSDNDSRPDDGPATKPTVGHGQQARRFRHEASVVRILYQNGNSEEELPVCEKWAVCSKVDLYQWPWVERQCRCPSGAPPCSQMLSPADGHTITDKTRQFKLCEPIKMLPKCRYFRDMAWTLRSEGNGTFQTVHCHCPKGSVAYLLKRQAYQTESQEIGYQYAFACSPQSRLRCQRKEPCRLFTVRKRQEMVDEVNTNTLCQCSHENACPSHHTDAGVIQSKNFSEENIRTYSGYCMPSFDE